MVVKIRLARFGKRHRPIYNIVVSQARTARDSKPMEVLGTYDPLPHVPLATEDPSDTPTTTTPVDTTTGGVVDEITGLPRQKQEQRQEKKRYKNIQLDTSRTKYWLGVGAQPSEPVWRLLSLVGLLEPKPGHTKSRNLSG